VIVIRALSLSKGMAPALRQAQRTE
jgi:hypothetical protein